MKYVAVITLSSIAACVVAASCAPSEIGEPLGESAYVNVVGSTTVALDRLRVAAIYIGEGGAQLAGDVAVTSTGTPVVIPLTPPREVPNPPPVEGVFLAGGVALAVWPIVFVAYLDADGSMGFQSDGELLGADDVVAVAADGPLRWGWVPNLAEQLTSLTPEDTNHYYLATNDRFAEFVAYEPSPGANRIVRTATVAVTMTITDVSLATARLVCGGRVFLDETTVDARALVDPSVGGSALCGLELAACTTATVAGIPPPELPESPADTTSVVERIQCRRRGGIEALVFETTRLVCRAEACACDRRTQADAVLTSSTARPDWWPCEDEVPFCDSAAPLYRADPACDEEEE